MCKKNRAFSISFAFFSVLLFVNSFSAGAEEACVTSAESGAAVSDGDVLSMEILTPPSRTEYFAFEEFSKEGLSVLVKYSNGTEKTLSQDELSVSYQKGDALRFGDEFVEVIYDSARTFVPITVNKAIYDVSLFCFDNCAATFDGDVHYPLLFGKMPSGADGSVLCYNFSGGATHVSEGEVLVTVDFFTESSDYEAPESIFRTVKIIPAPIAVEWEKTSFVYDGSAHIPTASAEECSVSVNGAAVGAGAHIAFAVSDDPDYFVTNEEFNFRIERAVVMLPAMASVVYNGEYRAPELPDGILWENSYVAMRDAGEYQVMLKLADKENFAFENGKTEYMCSFTILPREVKVRVSDTLRYLGGKYSDTQISIIGEDVPEAELDISLAFSDGKVWAKSENPNYRLIVYEGRVVRSFLPHPEARPLICIVALVASLALLLILILWKRHTNSAFMSGAEAVPSLGSVLVCEKDALLDSESCYTALAAFSLPIDALHADSLISNSLAKTLICEGVERVYTSGNKKCTVSMDVLSCNFKAGARVDINSMKEKGIVPKNASCVKVVARGSIDKPLFVYANDFGTTALKMIALSGGKSYRVKTGKIKQNKDKI